MSLGDPLPGLVINEDTRAMAVGISGGLNVGVIIGTANKGEEFKIEPISSVEDLVRLFGSEDLWDMSKTATKTPLGLVRGCKLFLKHSNQLYAMRVVSSSAAKASMKIYPDENQYQEFLSYGNALDFTLKAVPKVSGATTVKVDGNSLKVVFDVAPSNASEVALHTKLSSIKAPGTMQFFDVSQVPDGCIIETSFYIDLGDIQVCELRANSKGTWGHEISFYVETSNEEALIENQEIIGSSMIQTYQLLYDDVPKSVLNDFYLQRKNDPTTRKSLKPIYIKSDTLHFHGEKTDSEDLDVINVSRLAQTFRTVDPITISEVKLRIKSSDNNDDVSIRIETLTLDGKPSGTLVHANAVGTIDKSDLDSNYQTLAVPLLGNVVLSGNSRYALVISKSGSDIVNVESIGYHLNHPHYYTDGNYFYYSVTDAKWKDDKKENSLLFSIYPSPATITSGQCVIYMKSWGDPANLANTARIKINDFDFATIDDYIINAKYKVSSDSNIRKLNILYGDYREEYIICSGKDLVRDINNNSSILEAIETLNSNLLPSAINNGSKLYPVFLSNGDNGSEATPTDFNNALEKLQYFTECYYVMIASQGRYNYQSYNSVDGTDDLASLQANLIAHVRLMSQSERGFERIGICGMRQKLVSETVGEFIYSGTDSISARLDAIADKKGRLLFVGHGFKVVDESPYAISTETLIPGALACCLIGGLLSSLPENITIGGKPVNGAIDLEFEMGYAEKKAMVSLGVICSEKAGGISVVRGVSTDPTLKWQEHSVRRIVDYIYARERAILKSLIHELNEADLWDVAKTSIIDLFSNLSMRKYITPNFSVSVSATRAEQAEGLCIVNQSFETIRPVLKFVLNTKIT